MIDRGEVVTEARTWLGTPYAHQGHTKRVATDCGGFVAGVGMAVGSFPADAWSTMFAEHAGYARRPLNGMLEAICRRYLQPIPIEAAREGDVVLMRFGTEPQHLALLAPYLHGGLSIIHAFSRARPPGVCEHRFADVWRARVTEAFAFPGVH